MKSIVSLVALLSTFCSVEAASGIERSTQDSCTSFTVIRFENEKSFATTPAGDSLSFGIYDEDGQIGYYFDSSTFTTNTENSEEAVDVFQGIYNGVYMLDFDVESGAYASQIFVTGVLERTLPFTFAVTGGLGRFACVVGTGVLLEDEIIDSEGNVVGQEIVFNICGACA